MSKYKRVEVTIINRDKPWTSSRRTKRYKVDVRQVKDFSEALREFNGMQGILRVLNDRLTNLGTNVFRSAMKVGRTTATAKKLARITQVPERLSRKKQHAILDGISVIDVNQMSPEDLQKMLKEITG